MQIFFSNKPTVKNEELVTWCSAAYIQKISFFWSKSSTLTVLRIYNISDWQRTEHAQFSPGVTAEI